MHIKGIVSEVSKKPKSWKMVIDGHNYYSKEDVSEFVGKTIEAEYTVSDPYKNATTGEMITSKYIKKESVKVLGNTQTGAEPEGKTYGAKPPEAHEEHREHKEPDWELINTRNYRRDCINCATALTAQGKIEIAKLTETAEELLKYILTGEMQIPF